MKNVDKANFGLDYLEIDWGEILEIDKQVPNVSIKKFNDKMNMLLDKHMPLKKVSQKEFKRKLKPWISNEIVNIKSKNFDEPSCIQKGDYRKTSLLQAL